MTLSERDEKRRSIFDERGRMTFLSRYFFQSLVFCINFIVLMANRKKSERDSHVAYIYIYNVKILRLGPCNKMGEVDRKKLYPSVQ